MGLLIGGSAMTVVELLDAVVYALMTKCKQNRRAKRQIRPMDEDVEEMKEESTPKPETLPPVENIELDLDVKHDDDKDT